MTSINFSFYSGGSYYGSETGLGVVSDGIKNNVRNILNNVISPLINLNFVEVSDSTSSYGQIRYLLSTSPGYAYAYYPWSTDTNQGNSNDRAGDVFLNPSDDNTSSTDGFQGGPGTHGYETLIHETLHALGVKHSGNYNGSGVGDPPYLPYGEENWDNTLMTYNFNSGAEPSTPMAYDVLALQYLYGAKSFNASNTTYTFTNTGLYSDGLQTVGSSTQSNKLTIWDSDGIDTLNFSNLGANTSGYRFDLNAGGWLSRLTDFNGTGYNVIPGPPVSFTSGTSYYATTSGTRLAYGVTIENLINSSSNDYIIANSAANVFSGYGLSNTTGADIIEGANNLDILDLSAFSVANVTQTQSGNNLLLGIGSGRSVTVKDYYAASAASRIQLGFSNLPSVAIAKTTDGSETGPVSSVFTLTRTGDITSALSVNYSLSGTATLGSDYTDPNAGIAIFGAGSATTTVTLPTLNDAVLDPNETIIATITAPTGYLGSGFTTATISDNEAVTYTNVSNLTSISIPSSGSGNPYPSNINVSGFAGNLSNLKVTLNNLSHPWPDDIDILLVGPTGAKTILMSDVGGTSISGGLNNVTFTFDALATTALADSSQLTSGTYRPTDFESGDIFNAPAPTGPYTADLSVFNNTNPNGTWNLYIMDDDPGFSGTLTGGWSLSLGGIIVNTNSTPTDLTLSNTSVAENQAIGTGIGTFTTTDPDTGNTFTYSLVTGTGLTDNALFTITGNQLQSNAIFDFETKNSYSIRVKTTDQGGLSYEKALTININDVQPTIILAVSPNAVNEDGSTNLVYTFTRDNDLSNSLTVNYAITGTATNGIDYTSIGTSITFAANSNTAIVTIDPTADITIESDETVTLTLAAGTGYAIGTTTAVTGTITNDDTAYTAIESVGNTKFIKDSGNKYFAQVGTATPIAIKINGTQISKDIFGTVWQTLAVETVNGENQVLWKNTTGNFLHIWKTDSNWNWVSSEGQWALNSAEAFNKETLFGVDADSDGAIGSVYTTVESVGKRTP